MERPKNAGFLDDLLAPLLRPVKQAYQDAVPLHLRTFGETLLGRRSPLTEDQMSENERQRMVDGLAKQQALREKQEYPGAALNNLGRPDGSTFIPEASTYLADTDIRSTFGKGGYRLQPDGTSVFTDSYDFHPNNGMYGGGEYELEGENTKRPGRLGAIAKLVKHAIDGVNDPGDELADIALGGASRKTAVRFSKEETDRFKKQLEIYKKQKNMTIYEGFDDQ